MEFLEASQASSSPTAATPEKTMDYLDLPNPTGAIALPVAQRLCLYNRSPILWRLKPQKTTALSSAKAEYYASSTEAMKLIWVATANLLADILTKPLHFLKWQSWEAIAAGILGKLVVSTS
jgi:hypothetical protein